MVWETEHKNRSNIKFQNTEQKLYELDVFCILITLLKMTQMKINYIYITESMKVVKSKRKHIYIYTYI